MKKIDLGQAIGVLANLGVITGIVFLAYETHQNSELLELQVRAAQLDQRMTLSATLFDQQRHDCDRPGRIQVPSCVRV